MGPLHPVSISLTRIERRQLADDIELAIDRAGRPTSPFTAAVPVSAHAAGMARKDLLDLAERLRQPGPVANDGLALVRRMLTDGTSPLYVPASPEDLRRAARQALEALDP